MTAALLSFLLITSNYGRANSEEFGDPRDYGSSQKRDDNIDKKQVSSRIPEDIIYTRVGSTEERQRYTAPYNSALTSNKPRSHFLASLFVALYE